jgi:hypothetical protein
MKTFFNVLDVLLFAFGLVAVCLGNRGSHAVHVVTVLSGHVLRDEWVVGYEVGPHVDPRAASDGFFVCSNYLWRFHEK